MPHHPGGVEDKLKSGVILFGYVKNSNVFATDDQEKYLVVFSNI